MRVNVPESANSTQELGFPVLGSGECSVVLEKKPVLGAIIPKFQPSCLTRPGLGASPFNGNRTP